MSAPLSPVPRSPTLYEQPTTPERRAKENWDIAFGGEDLEKKPQAAEVVQPSRSKEAEPPTFPDGGLRAWLVVLGGSFVLACTFGYMNAFGVYQSFYTQTYLPSYSASAVSWIGSLQIFFIFSMGIFTGRLFDQGYFHHLMIIGSVIFIASLFAQSAAQPDQYYQVFLSQAVGQGIGQGCIYLPSVAIMSHWFNKKRAVAIGIIMAASSLGGVIFPIMLNNLFITIGYAWTVRAVAFLMGGLLLIANLIMRPRLPPRKDLPAPPVKKLLTDPPYVLAFSGMFFAFWSLFFPFFFIQLYAGDQGVSANFSFYTLSILNATSVVGRTLPTFFARSTGPMTIVILSLFLSGGMIFIMAACTNLGSIATFIVLYGLLAGGFVSLMAPMFGSMADNVGEIGSRLGFAYTFIGVASLTGTPIAGALIGNGPDYVWYPAILFAGMSAMVGSILLSISWVLLRKKKGKSWV